MALPSTTLARGRRVALRDRLPADVDSYLRWRVHGEWRWFDAPWEVMRSAWTQEEARAFRDWFLQSCAKELTSPRERATITTREDKPLGWVNRYMKDRFPDVWFVGIDICEDDYLGRGFGTEALRLWIDYLFSNSEVHRLSLDTWSFNPRMMRVAEKLGFISEGAERELIEWQGRRLDLVHYGLLRREWQVGHSHDA